MAAINFFVYLAEIIIGATLMSAVLRKFNQPTFFAYIVAGIIIGPLVLGSINFGALGLPFELGIHEISPELRLLADLGTAFLLFSIGIETSVAKLFRVGKPLLLGTAAQVLLVVAITVLSATALHLLTFEQGLFVGTIVAFSSTMIAVKILSDKKETNTLSGKVIISVALIQDFLVLLAYPLLANIYSLGDITIIGTVLGKAVLLVLIGVILNRLVFQRLFAIATKEQELFFLSSVSTAFLFIGLGFILDVPITIAGFIGGVALSTLTYNTAIFAKVRALRDFFLVIFFVTLGAQLNFSLGAVPLPLILLIVLIVFVLKPLTTFLVITLSGYGGNVGADVSFSLMQISEFGFAMLALGISITTASGTAIISPELFSFLVALTAISMLVTPWFIAIGNALWKTKVTKLKILPKLLQNKFFSRQILVLAGNLDEKKLKNHILIVGGNVSGRELARKLIKNKESVLLVDDNPDVVLQGQKEGLPIVYNASDDSTIFEKEVVLEAKLIVITIKDFKESKLFVESARAAKKDMVIYCTAAHFEDALVFYRLGVDFVAMPSIVGAEQLFDLISLNGKKLNRAKYEQFRSSQISYINKAVLEEKKYNTRLLPQ